MGSISHVMNECVGEYSNGSPRHQFGENADDAPNTGAPNILGQYNFRTKNLAAMFYCIVYYILVHYIMLYYCIQ